MKKRYVLIFSTIIAILTVSVVSAGLFDGLMNEKGQSDNVIEIDGITFNTTNATNFTKTNEEKFDIGTESKAYWSENGTGNTSFTIYDYSKVDDNTKTVVDNDYTELTKRPSQTINGVVVYTQSYTGGDNVGKPCYTAMIKNDDLKKIYGFGSPDANETAKMVLSFKINEK